MSAKRFKGLKRVLFGVITALVILVITLPLGLFFYQYERVPKQVYQDAPSNAARDPLLALERYLERVGVGVTHTTLSEFRRRGLSISEPMLLLDHGRGVLDEKHDALLAWVKDGGHLIMAAVSDPMAGSAVLGGATAHPLLSSLGVELTEQVRPEPIDPALDPAGAESLFEFIEQMTSGDLTLVIKKKENEPAGSLEKFVWRIMIPGTTSLQANQETEIQFSGTNRSGHQFLQIAYGKGRVSILKTFDPLFDHTLLDEEHLHFILSLLDVPSPQTTKVTWLIASHPPPWMWLAIQQAPLAFLLLLLAGMLWAWRSSVRFGPPLDDFEASATSRQAEHIEASGWLIWKNRAGKELIDRLRRGLERRIEKRYPGALSLPERGRFDFLAAHTGLPSEVLVRALYDDQAKKSRRGRFVDTIKAIQQVSRSL